MLLRKQMGPPALKRRMTKAEREAAEKRDERKAEALKEEEKRLMALEVSRANPCTCGLPLDLLACMRACTRHYPAREAAALLCQHLLILYGALLRQLP